LKGLFLPIALLIATLAPIYTGAILWPLQSQNALTDIVFRSWMLFPILIVPIVLVAWQYSIKITLIVVTFTAFYDLPFILFSVENINMDAIPFIGVPILRSIALGIVGTIVSLLMTTQRSQRKRLMEANVMLSEHARTLEQLAISCERNRLARELHDTLAHTLSSQILTLEALKLSANPKDNDLNDSLDKLIDNTRRGLDDTRRALKDLRARQLEDLGLTAALKSLIADAASRSELSTQCFISKELPLLPSKVEQSIYRIAQEAIENIIRHSNATNMELKLTNAKGLLTLEISDNGEGFAQHQVDNTESMGVKGMRERAAEIGDEFSIESKPRSGTRIRTIFKV
jgi:signal transduction histidine kinase